jgi:hypothetical protein
MAGVALASAAYGADSWGLQNETVTEIEATVVDVACVLTRDCPPQCGGGKRQLGLLTAEGKLRLAAKGATNFAGAVRELLPHCGKAVLADGLLIENPALTIFMVQNLRLSKSEKLQPATAFEAEWTKQNGKADEWFRADPRVKAVIEADGVFGIKGLKPAP